MDHKDLLAKAPDVEVHKALIAFMVSPEARSALALMPMSSIHRFMEQLMTPGVLKAYLEFEASVSKQAQQRQREDDQAEDEGCEALGAVEPVDLSLLEKAREMAVGRARSQDEIGDEIVLELEAFLVVMLVELSDFDQGSAARWLDSGLGGVGIDSDALYIMSGRTLTAHRHEIKDRAIFALDTSFPQLKSVLDVETFDVISGCSDEGEDGEDDSGDTEMEIRLHANAMTPGYKAAIVAAIGRYNRSKQSLF